MNGSQFVAEYASKGPAAWEAAALDLARNDGLTPWSFTDITMTDGANTVTVPVMTDFLAIGPTQDFVRLPLTATMAQNICNLFGWLLPTPELAWQTYLQSAAKVPPTPISPNPYANLKAYQAHSATINTQLAALGAAPGAKLLGGAKKHVVVSNIMKPGMEVIIGWWKLPPAPLVYDDGQPWDAPNRQPIQVKSNAHAVGYVDYSHGIQPVGAVSKVNAPGLGMLGEVATAFLYQHPVLSKLVSREGPLNQARYKAAVQPPLPVGVTRAAASVARGPIIVPRRPITPSIADQGLSWVKGQPFGGVDT